MRYLLPTLAIAAALAVVGCGSSDGQRSEAASAERVAQAHETARRATQFLCDSVSAGGGYLWAYSRDPVSYTHLTLPTN